MKDDKNGRAVHPVVGVPSWTGTGPIATGLLGDASYSVLPRIIENIRFTRDGVKPQDGEHARIKRPGQYRQRIITVHSKAPERRPRAPGS